MGKYPGTFDLDVSSPGSLSFGLQGRRERAEHQDAVTPFLGAAHHTAYFLLISPLSHPAIFSVFGPQGRQRRRSAFVFTFGP